MAPEQGGDMEPTWFLLTLICIAISIYGYGWLAVHIIRGLVG